MKRFKCEYCGLVFDNPVPHKCAGRFRKHHLKFINLNPTIQETIRDLKKKLGIPRNLDIFGTVDYLASTYGLSVHISRGNTPGTWMEAVIEGNSKKSLITQDFSEYTSFKSAMEAGLCEALCYIDLHESKPIISKTN